jgi:NAD(P)H-dependent FMN reductase
MKLAIIIGSTRQGTLGKPIAEWVLSQSKNRSVHYEIVDVATFQLPLFGEVDATEQKNAWQSTLASFDGFIFLTAEYNHTITGSLKNALDYALEQWFDKPAAIVSYGYAGGARAAEHLRSILGALGVADIRQHVLVNLNTEFHDQTFTPAAHQVKLLEKLFVDLERWAKALKTIR